MKKGPIDKVPEPGGKELKRAQRFLDSFRNLVGFDFPEDLDLRPEDLITLLQRQIAYIERKLVQEEIQRGGSSAKVGHRLNRSGLHHFGGKARNLGRLALMQNVKGEIVQEPLEVTPPWLVIPPEAYNVAGTCRVYQMKDLLEGSEIEAVVNGRTVVHAPTAKSYARVYGPSREDLTHSYDLYGPGMSGFYLWNAPLSRDKQGDLQFSPWDNEADQIVCRKLVQLHAKVLAAFPAGSRIVLRPSFEGEDDGFSPPSQGQSVCFQITEDPEPFVRTIFNLVRLVTHQMQQPPRSLLVGPEVAEAQLVVQIESKKGGLEIFVTSYQGGQSLKNTRRDEFFGFDYIQEAKLNRWVRKWRESDRPAVAALLDGLDEGQRVFNQWSALRSPEGPSYQHVFVPTKPCTVVHGLGEWHYEDKPCEPLQLYQSSLFSEQFPALMEVTEGMEQVSVETEVERFFTQLYLRIILGKIDLKTAYEQALVFFKGTLQGLSDRTGLPISWSLETNSIDKIPYEPYQAFIMNQWRESRRKLNMDRAVKGLTPVEAIEQLKGIHMALLRGLEQVEALNIQGPRLGALTQEVRHFNRLMGRHSNLEYIFSPTSAVAVQLKEQAQVAWRLASSRAETSPRRGNMTVDVNLFKRAPQPKRPVALPQATAEGNQWQPLCWADTVWGQFDRTVTGRTPVVPGYTNRVFVVNDPDKKSHKFTDLWIGSRDRMIERKIAHGQLLLGHMLLGGGSVSNHGHTSMMCSYPFQAMSSALLLPTLRAVRAADPQSQVRAISDAKKGGLFVTKETAELLLERLEATTLA